MKNISEIENKAFLDGSQVSGSTKGVSYPPLFIDARGRHDSSNDALSRTWRERTICLLHGEAFHWKKRCHQCGYFIAFFESINGEVP